MIKKMDPETLSTKEQWLLRTPAVTKELPTGVNYPIGKVQPERTSKHAELNLRFVGPIEVLNTN